MPCDLDRIYGRLTEQLPGVMNSEPFLLDENTLPPTPSILTTDRLRILHGSVQYLPGCLGDTIDVIASRPVLRQLGLLSLSILFHVVCDRSTIHLIDPQSHVKSVVIEHKHWDKTEVSGYWTRPWAFGYVAEDVNVLQSDEVGLSAPIIRLTNLADNVRSETDWKNRDTLRIHPSAEIAEFLLNAGCPAAKRDHFHIPANGSLFTAATTFLLPEAWQRRDENRMKQRELGYPV
jgi:hypothetical protein